MLLQRRSMRRRHWPYLSECCGGTAEHRVQAVVVDDCNFGWWSAAVAWGSSVHLLRLDGAPGLWCLLLQQWPAGSTVQELFERHSAKKGVCLKHWSGRSIGCITAGITC